MLDYQPRSSRRGGPPPRRLRGGARAGRAEPGLIPGNWGSAQNRRRAGRTGVERALSRRLSASHTVVGAESAIVPGTWAEARDLERAEWAGGHRAVSGRLRAGGRALPRRFGPAAGTG